MGLGRRNRFNKCQQNRIHLKIKNIEIIELKSWWNVIIRYY